MILVQTAADLGYTTPLGVYYDEVELTDQGGQGLSVKASIEELNRRAADVLVIAAKFEVHNGRGHPSYNIKRVAVTGDMYQPQ